VITIRVARTNCKLLATTIDCDIFVFIERRSQTERNGIKPHYSADEFREIKMAYLFLELCWSVAIHP